MAENRRTSTRHAVSLPAQLTLVEESAPRQCTVVNLSLGGALFALDNRLAMGTRVDFRFSVPTLEEPIVIGATVRWSDDKATGIQFDGLRAREVWALNKFFEQLPVVP
ncbi:MAG TPA: PilZ domain-containing protein [Kofleriaceae bacterium]|nr:PilZ domain-containing protein [Kofleriaceae bacterium]